MMRVSRPILLALAFIGLGACQTPLETFEISAPRLERAEVGATRAQLLIPEPTAIKTLDSERIVVKPTPYSVEYLAESQWSDRLPRMVQLRLLQAFENTGRVGAVGVPGQGLAIDYQIILEIRRFEVDVVNGRQAIIEISVKALNDRNGSVRRTQIFTASAPVVGTGNAAFVASLDQAFAKISSDIVAWTLALV
ncbi:ABC-type transport auxiliary lipoprotein family protein [Fulvimarina sp. 2208YS6-2-32]|uniref:ABC-type transport auxiliary lipoprotein family protein n=1 Tax=Fulvimarina uroteuthidis TaxID=3098149 RepID=A0ABU5I405_9HYPH|nr:ABC-type transport auxiliary lipoprotein family protein [Fulvimarina sp. 2208YS6-2-32]MDY8109539.1 ABC-type transport auxiliary lipoprotein family protein [Fulvimarina sp. 2208YS6-2-32]